MSARTRFLDEFPKALADDVAAIFVGAGVSVGAGYPSWKALLRDIGEELGVRSDDVLDLAALAQWSIRASSGRTRVLQVIKDEIGVERPIPETLEVIARLPVRNIWTTNYDRLIERAFASIGRPIDAISVAADLSLRPRAGACRLFKMHGSVERLEDIVIATDDYELFKLKRGAFLPLLQAHMTSLSLLFVGLSFLDPNVRHVLSLIRESFVTSPPEHFAIARPPQRDEYSSQEEYQARSVQHKLWADDLLRYGLHVVEIDDYEEVPSLLRDIERQTARHRVWVSGSWPTEAVTEADTEYVYQVSEGVGRLLADQGYSLVSGTGLTVGSASVGGFLYGLQRTGAWDLERRLIARPFPQPYKGADPDTDQWAALRSEMARLSGVVIFVGGLKVLDGCVMEAEGVTAEMEAARAVGAFLLPIGSTGGATARIAKLLVGSDLPVSGKDAQRPTDDELKELSIRDDPARVIETIKKVLVRVSPRPTTGG